MPKLKFVVVRLVQGLLFISVVAGVTGCAWQSYASKRDLERFPPPGAMVDVGTHKLHIDCRGSGSPTVLLESGAQLWSSGWRHVHQALAQNHRVCAYDRAGLGWSETGPLPYDANQAVAELKVFRFDTIRGRSIPANKVLLSTYRMGIQKQQKEKDYK
jgi:hypothetical protein